MSARSAGLMRGAIAALSATVGVAPVLAQQPASIVHKNPDVHRVLVIPVNLRGHAPVGVDRKQIVSALFGSVDSVAQRYRAISGGRLEFVGSANDIAAPITLAEPADLCHAGLGALASEAEAALTRAGLAYGAYRHLVFVVPVDVPCRWTGVGDIGGHRVWVKATTAKALQHELGHNLGMNHALRWRGGEPDASDFMGSGATNLNAPHVVQMGWLDPGQVVEPAAAATVTLATLEARGSALPKVAIVHSAPGGNTYYFSTRAASADYPLTDEFTRGLNIHIFDGARTNGGLTYFVASLADGAVYRDGPMVVTQVSHVPGRSVTFRIAFDGAGKAMPAGPPPGPPATLQSLASGKCVDLPAGEVRDGTAVIQYDCHGGANQQWQIVAAHAESVQIVSRLSGKCLGVESAGAGTGIVQSHCDGADAQLWARAGSGFRNIADGLCLDVPGASLANGAKLIGWICNGGINQTWRYEAPGGL